MSTKGEIAQKLLRDLQQWHSEMERSFGRDGLGALERIVREHDAAVCALYADKAQMADEQVRLVRAASEAALAGYLLRVTQLEAKLAAAGVQP